MGHLRSGLRFGVLGEFASCPKFFSVSKRWHESSEKKQIDIASVTGPGFLLYALQVFIKLTGKKPGEVGLF